MTGHPPRQSRLAARGLALLAVTLALACGATAAPSGPAAGPSPTAAARLDLALVDAVFPRGASGTYAVCGIDGDTAACPYTDRLKSRLAAARVTLCRCQSPAPDRSVSIQGTPSGGRVIVIYGDQQFELAVVSAGGRWLVDDETCLGGAPETSIYRSISPCESG